MTKRRKLVEQQILQEAASLFAERGFAGTNLQDIAEAMGMTRSSLYYYVENKEDLFARLVAVATEEPANEIRRLAEDAATIPSTRLREIAFRVALRRATDPTYFQMVLRSVTELPAEAAAANRAAERSALKALSRLIETGTESGEFRPVDPRTAALAILGMCNWVAWWYHADGVTPEVTAKRIADLALAMVRETDSRAKSVLDLNSTIALLRTDLDHLERLLDPAKRQSKRDASVDIGSSPVGNGTQFS